MDTFRSNWKQILRIRLIKTWLLGLLTVSGCLQGTLIREDNNINSSSKIRPFDVDTSTAENIGQEALEKIGYNEIIKLSIKAGFVEYKTSMNIKLVSYESAVIADFTPVFSRYALAAAVTSQADSPIPGPADLAALGVIVVGLIDAGLLDGYLLNTTGAWLASASGKLLMSKASTKEVTGTEPAAESPGTADATGTEAGAQETSAGGWCKGSYPSAAESLKAHFEKHGPEVGAQTVEQYLNKARGFANNLRGAQRFPVKGATEGVVRYVKNGRYIDLAPDQSIISFGAR